jgi:glycosyltransferase involved in cell wall biosynthesis
MRGARAADVPRNGRENVKIVCFSEIQWRYVRTRKQQILSRLPADWEILFLSSVVRGKPNNYKPMRDGRIVHACVPAMKNFPQKPVQALFSLPPVRFLWNAIVFLWLAVVFRATGFHTRDRVFYVSNIYYSAILPLLERLLMLYDCNDDPLSFPNAPRWARGYFDKLVRTADVIVAVSRGLVEVLRAAGAERVHHIGNGVDYDLFAGAAGGEAPCEMRALRRPVLGYSGAIAPWFDLELLGMIVSAFPDATVALLGPVYPELRGAIEELERTTEVVRYLGVKPYEELGAYLAAMDVCMIPLRRNELMRLADPNKLYEYAAVGRPIVTMRFSEEMDEVSGFVYLARTREEFVAMLRKALSAGSAHAEQLRAYAKQRSWQARADEIANLIREARSPR